MPRKPSVGKSLAEVNPELAKEWHPTKNGSLIPYDVFAKAGKKAWWKCPEGDDHEWEATIASRSSGNGCPVCSGKIVRASNCLATLNPSLASEWHPTKNGDFTPYKLTENSPKKVWWKCPKGDDHEWMTSPNSRFGGSGCPICSNQIVVKSNCLKTTHPQLVSEWNYQLNKITPYDITSGSNKKVWWKCPKGDDHVWKTAIVNRENGQGCPYCAGKKVSKTNCLGMLNPLLSKQWHPTKNNSLTPFQVTLNSGKKVWWKCPEGDDHEWHAAIYSRADGVGCPICSRHKVVLSNCLATTKPSLLNEWHPTLNKKLTPYNVSEGCSKMVWWKCSKGDDHVWKTNISNRSKKGSSCPICSNYKIVKSNSLQTLNPTLASQWHPSKNKKITPNDVGVGSNKKVWWKCPKGDDHEWRTSVVSRHNGSDCPICANQKIVKSNSLHTINPILASEWHSAKNKKHTPHDVGVGSNKKVWWKCSKGDDHEWRTSIRNRSEGSNCPYCSGRYADSKNNISVTHKSLLLEWDFIRNGKLKPSEFKAGSHKKVW